MCQNSAYELWAMWVHKNSVFSTQHAQSITLQFILFFAFQVTGSMAGVVKAMESAMKSMNLEKVIS